MKGPYPIPGYIKDVMDALEKEGAISYVVGGAVRNLILDQDPHDYDIATDMTPDKVSSVLEGAGFRLIDCNGLKHGTVVALSQGEPVEITTFRTESGYSDNRHPDQVSFANSIEEDVKRRDFTMNALYLGSDNMVRDTVGGIADIEKKLIRAVGDPQKRFREDALRILRGIRFSSRLGFEIEEETAKAMKDTAHLLGEISPERIRSEMDGIVSGLYAPDAIRDNLDVLSVVIPGLKKMEGFDQRTPHHDRDVLEHTLDTLAGIPDEEGKRDEVLSYAAIFHDIAKPDVFYLDKNGRGHMKGHAKAGEIIVKDFMDRYRFSNDRKKTIAMLVRYHDDFTNGTKKGTARLMSEFEPEFLDKLFVLQRADILAHSNYGSDRMDILEKTVAFRQELISEGACVKISDLAVDGNDILALGTVKREDIGSVLKFLLDAVIDGKVNNFRDLLLNYVEKWHEI